MSDASLESDAELVDFLASVDMLAPFSREELESLAGQMSGQWYEFGDNICQAGEPCTGPMIIRSGSVRTFATEGGKETSMGVRKAGDVIGEIGALREEPHDLSARASSKTEVLFVPMEALRRLTSANQNAAGYITSYVAIRAAGGVVNRLFNLKGKVDQDELRDLVSSVGAKRVEAGATILEQGSRADRRLYVVRQGVVNVVRAEAGTDINLGGRKDGELFGESAALNGGDQFATVTAQKTTVVLIIPEDTVKALVARNSSVENLLKDRIEKDEREVERQQQLAVQRGSSPIIDFTSKSKLGEKVLTRFQLIEQAEEMDCGAACLAMICKHYGVNATLGKLREMANVTVDGATMDSLATAGEALGFTVRGLDCHYESMLGFELPFIAHWEGYHYIVVYGVSKSHVWVADPARGYSKMSRADFEKGWTGKVLNFTASSELLSIAAGASPWVRFAKYLEPFRGVLGYIILATLVVEILGVAPPIIVQNILDRVVVNASVDLLTTLIIGFVIVQVFANLTTLMRGMLSNYLVRNLDFSMISQFFRHTLSLPLSFFDSRRTGDIFARFQENQTVRGFLTESTISTLLNVLMVFIYFAVLFMYSVTLTGVLIALIIPMALLTLAVTPRLKAYARAEFEASTDAEAVLMETITGAETVKAMNIERAMRNRWEKRYVNALQVQYRSGRFDLLVGFVSQLLNAGITITILWLGANMVLSQELTIGQLIAFNMLMGSALSPIMGLIGLWDEIQETSVAMERLGDVLDIEPEQRADELGSRIVLPDLQGDYRLQDVYFRYGAESAYVLEGINLEIKQGEVVAIVGQSGSGKTTLAKLIAGFYPPVEGSIFVDDYDMEVVDQEYYRSQIGYVMQSNLLFSGTVAENIAVGEEDLNKNRVMEVAKLADAHGFISQLPLGYEQMLGERGTGLSGGQMQRLCIARALYRDPRVLILDEATSALDSQSESNILNNMNEMLEGRTAIIIAHRLSTIMNADKIVVLYDGAIVEQGTHDELIDRAGMYYQLVSTQLTA